MATLPPMWWERNRRSEAKKRDAAREQPCSFKGARVKQFWKYKKLAKSVSLWNKSKAPGSRETSAAEIEDLLQPVEDAWFLSRAKRYENRQSIAERRHAAQVHGEDEREMLLPPLVRQLPPINSKKYDRMFPRDSQTPCREKLVSTPKLWPSKNDPPFPWEGSGAGAVDKKNVSELPVLNCLACNTQSQLNLKFSTGAEFAQMRIPFRSEFERRVKEAGCGKVSIGCRRKGETVPGEYPSWLVPGSVEPLSWEKGSWQQGMPFNYEKETAVGKMLYLAGKHGKGRVGRLASQIYKYEDEDTGFQELCGILKAPSGDHFDQDSGDYAGALYGSERVENSVQGVVNEKSIAWAKKRESERMRLRAYHKRFGCFPDGSGDKVVDLKLMPGMTEFNANQYKNAIAAKRKGGRYSRKLGDFSKITDLPASCRDSFFPIPDITAGGSGNASREAELPFSDVEWDGIPLKSWRESPTNEDITTSGLAVKPGMTMDSLGGNMEDYQIGAGTELPCMYQQSQYTSMGVPSSGNSIQSRYTSMGVPSSGNSREYYKDNCCAIQTFNHVADEDDSKLPNFFTVNCNNEIKYPLTNCRYQWGNKNGFKFWFPIWLIFAPSSPSPLSRPFTKKQPVPITKTPIPSNIFSLQISCYPLSCFFNYYYGVSALRRPEGSSGGGMATRAWRDDVITKQWLKYLFDNNNSGKSNLENNMFKPIPSPKETPPYFNLDSIFRATKWSGALHEWTIEGNPALNAITNYKPEMILELQKTVAEKLANGNTVVLLVNDSFLCQTWSIYIKKNISVNQENPGVGLERSGKCSSSKKFCTIGAGAATAHKCLVGDGNCSRINFNISNTQIIITGPPNGREIETYVQIILESLIIKILHLELILNYKLWYSEFGKSVNESFGVEQGARAALCGEPRHSRFF